MIIRYLLIILFLFLIQPASAQFTCKGENCNAIVTLDGMRCPKCRANDGGLVPTIHKKRLSTWSLAPAPNTETLSPPPTHHRQLSYGGSSDSSPYPPHPHFQSQLSLPVSGMPFQHHPYEYNSRTLPRASSFSPTLSAGSGSATALSHASSVGSVLASSCHTSINSR